MRFSLRSFLIVLTLMAASFGWFAMRYQRRLAEQRVLSDLQRDLSLYQMVHLQPGDEKLYLRYSNDRLASLVEQYGSTAIKDETNKIAAQIAGAALAHIGSRLDTTSLQFLNDPRAIPLAERFAYSNIEPLAASATWILLRHHRLSDDLSCSGYCAVEYENGFDDTDPFDVYVLAAMIQTEFDYGDQEFAIEENWPVPEHPWELWSSAQHTYQDNVDALQKISPKAAAAYTGILEILSNCDARPTDAQREQISQLSMKVSRHLTIESIFRFMLKNLDEFKSRPEFLTAVQ